LKHFELLDDVKFAKWWVSQRLAFKKISSRVLKLELGRKGISKNTIDDVLDKAPIDEEKMARELLERRDYKWANLDPKIAKQKKFQYLAGKGFDWEVIEKVVIKKV
jgi:regulatory protein